MAARGLGVEITKEFIGAGLKWPDIDDDFLAARDDFFAPQLDAFKLFRRVVGVFDGTDQILDRAASRRADRRARSGDLADGA